MSGDSVLGNMFIDASDSSLRAWNGSKLITLAGLTNNDPLFASLLDPQSATADTIPVQFNREFSCAIKITRILATCDSSNFQFVIGSRGQIGGTVAVIDTLTTSSSGTACYYKDSYSFDSDNVPKNHIFWIKPLGSQDPTWLTIKIWYEQNP